MEQASMPDALRDRERENVYIRGCMHACEWKYRCHRVRAPQHTFLKLPALVINWLQIWMSLLGIYSVLFFNLGAVSMTHLAKIN